MRLFPALFYSSLILAALLLPLPRCAGLPIEQAQREFQARYYFINGGYVAWPGCPCGTPAPAFPADKFYGDLDHNPVLAVQLVQDLADKFFPSSGQLFLNFLTNTPTGSTGIEDQTYPPTTWQPDDFPLNHGSTFDLRPGSVTLQNCSNSFIVLRSYIQKLQCVGQDAAVGFFESRGTAQIGSTNSCDEARTLATSALANASWFPAEAGPIGINTASWVYSGSDPPLKLAMASNLRGSIYSSAWTLYPGLGSGNLLVYISLTPLAGGTDGTSPPVDADNLYHSFESLAVSAGFEYSHTNLAGGNPTVEGDCFYEGLYDGQPEDPRAYHGWTLNGAFLVLKPDFNTTSDPIPCGADPCASCADDSANLPGKVTASNHSLDLRISLGPDAHGRSAGYFYLHADQPGLALFCPGGLICATPGSITPVNDAGHTFPTPNGYATVTPSNTGYTIVFTDWSSQFLASVIIYSNSPTSMLITEQLGPDGSPRTIQFNYTSLGPNSWTWDMIEGGGLRVESRTTTWTTPTSRNDTVLIKPAGGSPVSQTSETYARYPWGLTLLQRVEGTGSSARTTAWTYYTDPAIDGGNYGQFQQVVEPSGRWEYYQYDTAGRLTNTIAQFGNNGPTNSGVSNRVTQVQYTPSLITTISKLAGFETARTYEIHSCDQTNALEQIQTIRCSTPGAALGATGNLTNILWQTTDANNFAGTDQAWDPIAELRPDGTMTLYQYNGSTTTNQTGDTGLAWADLVAWSPAVSSLSVLNGTQTTTTVGDWGEPRSTSVQDLTTTLELVADTYTYPSTDPLRRSHTVTHLGNLTETFTYSCCGLHTYTDRDGVTTEYYYDDARRQIASRRLGIVTTNLLDAAGNVLVSLRYGSNGPPVILRQAAFDLAGRLTAETNSLNGPTTYTETFAANGRTLTTTYPDTGTRIELYNQDGSLQSVTGTAAFPAYYAYGIGTEGSFTRETKDTADGSEWTTTYTDMLGRSWKTLYASASGTPAALSYYNARGQLTNQVDPDGVSILYTYNAKGEAACSILDSNRNHQIDWSGPDRITLVTNDVTSEYGSVARRTRTFAWTENDTTPTLLSAEATSADGLQTWHTVYNNGVPITRRSETVLDAATGLRVTTTTSPDNSTTVTTNQYSQPISVTRQDANGAPLGQTVYGYDAHRRPHTIIDARNGTTTRAYRTGTDLLESITTPPPGSGQSAQVTTFHYNSMLQVTNTVELDNTSVFTEYYPTGLRKRTFGSRTYPVGYTYDGQGRVHSITTWQDVTATNTAAITLWNYDTHRGWLTGKTYNTGLASGPVYSNTPAGRLARRTWARGIQTSYGYNAAGDLATVTYSTNGANLGYGYDRRGRLTSVSQGGTPLSSLTYNDANQLLTEAWLAGPSSGLSVRHLYDDLLRRTNTAVLSGASTVLAASGYGYDAASRLHSASDGTNSASYSYESMSPLVSQVAFARNDTERLTLTRQWDKLNRLRSISSGVTSFTYGYNQANQRTNSVLADSSRWVYTYDTLGQVTSGKKYWGDGTPVAGQQFEYTFDDIGNRKTAAAGGDQTGANLRTAYYTNSTLNWLTGRTVPGYLEVLGSANSNATVTLWSTVGQFPTPAGTLTRPARHGDYFSAELAPNNATGAVWLVITNLAVRQNGTNADVAATNIGSVLLPQSPETFGYDLDGNVTNTGRWILTWDAENRPTSFASLLSVPSASKKKVDCFYDHAWRRTQKLVSTNGPNGYVPQFTNRYVYEGWNLVAELASDGTLLRSHVWGLDASGSKQGAGGVGGLLATTIHTGPFAGTYFPAYDGNYNVVAYVRASDGQLVARYEHGPFGELLRASGPMAREFNLLFSTKYYDWETRFYYYGYRYYDPSTGRVLLRQVCVTASRPPR